MYAKIYNEILKVEYDFDRSTWMSLVLLSISWKFKIPRFGKIGSVCISKGVLAIVLIIRFRKISRRIRLVLYVEAQTKLQYKKYG